MVGPTMVCGKCLLFVIERCIAPDLAMIRGSRIFVARLPSYSSSSPASSVVAQAQIPYPHVFLYTSTPASPARPPAGARGPGTGSDNPRRFSTASILIDGQECAIPYADCTIGAVAETANLTSIVFDCRKGTCKTCRVFVTLEDGEETDVLACQEPAFPGLRVRTQPLSDEQLLNLTLETNLLLKQSALDREKVRRKTRRLKLKPKELVIARRKLEVLVAKTELAVAMDEGTEQDGAEIAKLLKQVDALVQDLAESDFEAMLSMHGNRANLLRDFFMGLEFARNEGVRDWTRKRKAEWGVG